MRDERLSAREKKTHKMSRDGLVERNQSTGEEQRVSQRGQDFQLRRGEPEQQSFSIRDTLDRHSRRRQRPHDSPETAQPSASDIAPDTTCADDVPMDTSAPSIPEQAPRESTRGQHARASPGETPSHKQRGTAYQRGFPQNSPSPGEPASEAPGNGPDRPHAAPMPDRSGGTPNPEPAPNQGDTPPSRLQFDKAARTKDRHANDPQHGSRYAQRFLPDQPNTAANSAPPSSAQQPSPAAEPPAKPTAPKLQFAAEEKPPDPPGQKLADSRLAKATHRAERVNGKLEQARKKLPARRRPAIKKEVNPDSGKAQRRLHFEKEIKTQRQHVKGPLPLRPVKAAGNAAVGYAHKKLYQAEEENVGTKAVHRTEMAAEGALRSAYRLHKTRPYRRVQRLQQKSVKMNARAAYRQALSENPKLRSNLFSRMAQKRRIKRQYAKAARDAKRADSAVKQAGNVLSKAFHSVVGVVRRHPVAVSAVALLLLMMMVISGIFTSCASMASGGMSAFLTASYIAPDADIDGAEVTYREWEADLQFQLDNAETDYPDFDEYLYSVDGIGHDPYLLMAYLTAKYGDFTLADVEADLREIFSEQYTLTFTPESETRYADPGDSDKDGDREPYIWRTLHITLTARPFAEVIGNRLNDEQKEHQELLMDSGGNRQYAGSPFPFDWRPYISCYYGWRVNPVAGLKDNHRAVDIAVAHSTPILAAHDGTVTISTLHDAYGYYIALDDGNGLVTKYAHCDQLLVGVGHEVKQGDVIALVGSTGDSTGPHLHYEVIKDGTYLNPLYFAHSGE